MKFNAMKKYLILLLLFEAVLLKSGYSQDFIPIWPVGQMPNSKGVAVADSLSSDLVYSVSSPGMYVFRPSNVENKGAAVLILPPGGYSVISYATGIQTAKWFNTIGVTAYVLIYRLPQSPDIVESYKAPLQDAQRAMRYIRSKAKDLGYDKSKIGVMGASAGGHIAACLCTQTKSFYPDIDSLDTERFTPDFAVLVSPVISMTEATHVPSRDNLFGKKLSNELLDQFSCQLHVSSQTPPAFIVHAENDQTVSPLNSLFYYTSLIKAGIMGSSLHVFPEGGHSIRVRKNPGTTSFWPDMAEKWLMEIGVIN